MPRPTDLTFWLVATGEPARRSLALEALVALPGVLAAHVDAHETWAMVEVDLVVTTPEQVADCLTRHGYPPRGVRTLG